MRKRLLPLLLAMLLILTALPALAQPDEVIELTFLMDWNGGAYNFPEGFLDGPISKAIEEKLGVRIKVETITSSETEKLAMVFASGDVADITNAPFWSTSPGGEGELIKKAALDGQLLALNSYIDNYPNIKAAMTEGISKAFLEGHLENADFNGERYIIPRKPKTDEDVTNWAYGVFARKDILETLKVDPASITSPALLRELLEKIKEGGFVDINGKPVIPAGNWHNGWSYDQYVLGFEAGVYPDWAVDPADGLVKSRPMLEIENQRILFMRNLIADGLYDAEALTQTDTMGKEKMATGRVATFGCHYPHQRDFFNSTLYTTHPEMEYVPLGPMVMENGDTPRSVNRKGAYGFGCLFISAECKYPEKALELIEFLSGEEGYLLSKFGIEGMHYNMVEGVPVRTEEWTKIKMEDSQRFFLEGFGYGELTTDDFMKSRGWDLDYDKEAYVHARTVRPLWFFDGYTAEDIAQQWEGRASYDEMMATVNYDDLKKVAMTAESDEAALAILDDYRAKMKAAGYDEMIRYVNDRIAEDPSIVYAKKLEE